MCRVRLIRASQSYEGGRMKRRTRVRDVPLTASGQVVWEQSSVSRLSHAMAWVLFLPAYAYMAIRHHNAFALSAVLGSAGTNMGPDSDLFRIGGMFDDGTREVETGYRAEVPSSVITVDTTVNTHANSEEDQLIAYLDKRIPTEWASGVATPLPQSRRA